MADNMTLSVALEIVSKGFEKVTELREKAEELKEHIDHLAAAHKHAEEAGEAHDEALHKTAHEAADAGDKFNKLENDIEKTSSKLRNFTQGLISFGEQMSQIGESIGHPLVEMADEAIEAQAELAHLSEKTGVSVEDLSRMSLAARENGVSMDQLATGYSRMSRTVDAAEQGGKAARETFTRLGITMEQLKNATPEQRMLMTVDALHKVSDAGTKGALAIQVFGRGAQALAPMLAEGSAGIEDMMHKADALGLVIDRGAAERALKASKAFKEMDASIEAVKIRITNDLLPAIEPLVKDIEDVATKASKLAEANPEWARFGVEVTAVGAAVTVFGGGLLSFIGFVSGGVVAVKGMVGAVRDWRNRSVEAAAASETSAGAATQQAGASEAVSLAAKQAAAGLQAQAGASLEAAAAAGVATGAAVAEAAAFTAADVAAAPLLPVILPIVAAVAVIAGVAYEVYENWGKVRDVFDDIGRSIDHAVEATGELFHNQAMQDWAKGNENTINNDAANRHAEEKNQQQKQDVKKVGEEAASESGTGAGGGGTDAAIQEKKQEELDRLNKQANDEAYMDDPSRSNYDKEIYKAKQKYTEQIEQGVTEERAANAYRAAVARADGEIAKKTQAAANETFMDDPKNSRYDKEIFKAKEKYAAQIQEGVDQQVAANAYNAAVAKANNDRAQKTQTAEDEIFLADSHNSQVAKDTLRAKRDYQKQVEDGVDEQIAQNAYNVAITEANRKQAETEQKRADQLKAKQERRQTNF